MKLLQNAAAAAALFAAVCAQAQVVGSVGGNTTSFVSLSSAGLGDGAIATLSGGTVYNTAVPTANGQPPAGIDDDGAFLVAGPSSGSLATLSFTGAGVSYVSFLWGSPDSYNKLTVTTTGGVETVFTPDSFAYADGDGNKATSMPVQFTASAGSLITGVSFDDNPELDSFEVANFSVTDPAAVGAVPEPGTYALMLAGMGVMGFLVRRRRG